jgi:SecD/SecF fusion protein
VAKSARNALIFSLLVICAYIAFRFDPKFAVPVLIAIFHDILITGGIYALTGREVTSGTVAAFLTILGYSLYDTIIVFDRIRENMPRMPRAAFSQIVNRSMSEVLTRSLATSFTTLLAVVSLLIFGGATLQDFAFAMMVGIISGTYSSIFIASPVLTAWKEREPGFARRRERIAAIDGSVPAFADEIELAKLGDGEATDAELEAEIAAQVEEKPKAGAVATVDPEPERSGARPSSNGEPPSVDPETVAKRERAERRRSRRQQRRKHGRNR